MQPVSPPAVRLIKTASSDAYGQTITGTVQWSVTPGQTVSFVEFYVDGVLSQTDASAPYIYNDGGTGVFDSTTLTNGTHVLGVRALSTDNKTYAFSGATVTVTNVPVNTTLPAISGVGLPGQTLSTSTGVWTNSPTAYTYQWQRCDGSGTNCSVIQGATASQYVVVTADSGSTIRSGVTASNSAGSNRAFSSPLTIGSAGNGGIALLQSNSAEGSNISSLSAGFPSANQAGNVIIAFVRMSTTSQTLEVTDTAGNTYSDAVSQAQSSDGHQAHIFYSKNIGGGANTVTARFSSTNAHAWIALYEYSGLSTTSPLDRTAHAQGSGTSVSSGTTSTTTTGNELLFAAVGLSSSYTGTVAAGTGYTLALQDTGTSRAANEILATSSAGAYAGTFTLSTSTNWSAVLATFAAGAASPSPTITTMSLPAGQQNTPYSATLTANNGSTPYTWSIISGSLPAGLSLASTTGVISGTPTATGTSNITVQVTDANSQSATQPLNITINGPTGSPIVLVQSNAALGSGVPSISAGFASANTAGNAIIAFVRMSTTAQTVQVTDSAGNAYTDAVSQVQSADGHQVHIFYAKNIAGGANTVKAQFSSTNSHPWIAVYEYRGLSTTTALDRTAAAQGSGSTVRNAATATTSSATELVFVGVGFPSSYTGTVTAGEPYVLAQQNTTTSRAATETAVVTSTGSYTGTLTLSSSTNWSAVTATFQH
jgi:methionine-rich copper-binding protein CopC